MLQKYKGPQKRAAADDTQQTATTPTRTKKTDASESTKKPKNDAKTQNSNKKPSEAQQLIPSAATADTLEIPDDSKTFNTKKRVQFEDQPKPTLTAEMHKAADQQQLMQKENIQLEANHMLFKERPSLTGPFIERSESLLVNPISEVHNALDDQEGSSDRQKRKVLDQMARIYVEQEDGQSCIISYHYMYKDYLYEYNLVDPERARAQEEMEKRKLAKQVDQQLKQKDTIKDNEVELENEDQDDITCPGKTRFDVLIKSMIARIEFNNCLAPIQEYGRHQKKVANKKKKKKKSQNQQAETTKEANGSPSERFDEHFYDLDDDFIDDGDLDINQDEMVTEMLYDGHSQMFSHTDQAEVLDPADKDLVEATAANAGGDPDDSDMDELAGLKQQQRYDKLLRNFRVLMPEEVDEMLRNKQEPRQPLLEEQKKPTQQLTLTSMISNQTQQKQKPVSSPNPASSAEKAKPSKKRDREEFNKDQRSDDSAIDEILAQLRQGVLNGGTLNTFKKEISNMADLLEKKDPQWNNGQATLVSLKLSQILQKPDLEMLHMLQRTSLLEKKKKKKNELEKLVMMANQKIKYDLKQQNKKSDDDFLEFESIDASQVKFSLTEDLRQLLPNCLKVMHEFISINNDYIAIKTQEEKLKAKRQKMNTEPKFEVLEQQQELEKMIVSLLSGIQVHLQTLVRERLMVGMGLINEVPEMQVPPKTPQVKETGKLSSGSGTSTSGGSVGEMPRKGNQWNKVTQFYESFNKK